MHTHRRAHTHTHACTHTHTHTHMHTITLTAQSITPTHKHITHTAHGISSILADAACFTVHALPQSFPGTETQLLWVVHTWWVSWKGAWINNESSWYTNLSNQLTGCGLVIHCHIGLLLLARKICPFRQAERTTNNTHDMCSQQVFWRHVTWRHWALQASKSLLASSSVRSMPRFVMLCPLTSAIPFSMTL